MLIIILSRVFTPCEIPLLVHESRPVVPVIKSNDDKIFLPLSAHARMTLIENSFNNIDIVFVLCASEAAMEEEERVDGLCGARSGARSGVGVDVDEEAADQEGLFSKLHYCGMDGVVEMVFQKRSITSMGTYICMSSYSQLIAY